MVVITKRGREVRVDEFSKIYVSNAHSDNVSTRLFVKNNFVIGLGTYSNLDIALEVEVGILKALHSGVSFYFL